MIVHNVELQLACMISQINPIVHVVQCFSFLLTFSFHLQLVFIYCLIHKTGGKAYRYKCSRDSWGLW